MKIKWYFLKTSNINIIIIYQISQGKNLTPRPGPWSVEAKAKTLKAKNVALGANFHITAWSMITDLNSLKNLPSA